MAQGPEAPAPLASDGPDQHGFTDCFLASWRLELRERKKSEQATSGCRQLCRPTSSLATSCTLHGQCSRSRSRQSWRPILSRQRPAPRCILRGQCGRSRSRQSRRRIFHDNYLFRGAFCVASAALRGHDARDRPLFTQQLPSPKSLPANNAGIQNAGFSGSC